MHVTVGKKDFLKLLERCHGVADKKSTMPILGNVLLHATAPGELTLSATDLQLSVSGTLQTKVEAQGSVAVVAKDLVERVNMMPEGMLSIKVADGSNTTLQALGQPRRYTLHGIPGDDFPQLPEPGAGAERRQLNVETLLSLITKTHFSISGDETRLHLNSALLEWQDNVVRMVTTDGHRLSKLEVKSETGSPLHAMLIPRKAVLELRRLCEQAKAEGEKVFELCQSGQNAFFTVGGVHFGVKLVDAQFPPYDQVIPSSVSNVIRAPRGPLAEALKAVQIAASDRTGGVKLTLDKNVIRLSSESPESGDGFDEIAVEYDGDGFTVGFNARYFLDVLGAVDAEEITLGISGELDPAVIRPADSAEGVEYLAVVMPMRI